MWRCTQWHDDKAFREGMDADQNILRTVRPHVENNAVGLFAALLDSGRRWSACELAKEVARCHKTVLHILHDILSYLKLAAHWIPHEISKVQE